MVTEGVALGLSTVVFESEESVALAELSAYQLQRLKDEEIRAEGKGGAGYYANTFLYLRCLRALGHQLYFRQFPKPLTRLEDLTDTGLVAGVDLGSPNTIIGMTGVLVESLGLARKVFDDL